MDEELSFITSEHKIELSDLIQIFEKEEDEIENIAKGIHQKIEKFKI